VWWGVFAAVGVLLLHQTGVRTKTPVAEGSAAHEVQRGTAPSAKRKVVFIAGPVSHAYGSHDHWPGARLLGRLLQENHSQIEAVVHRNGWPADPTAFDGAAAIVIYADGGARHPAITHLPEMDAMMKRGVGLVLMHYAVQLEENSEETPPAAWLSTEAPAAVPAPVAGAGGRPQHLTRAQRAALLEEWHKSFPPASTIR
jgi:hypothetical protein